MYYYQPFYLLRKKNGGFPLWHILESEVSLNSKEIKERIMEENGGQEILEANGYLEIILVEPVAEISKEQYNTLYQMMDMEE